MGDGYSYLVGWNYPFLGEKGLYVVTKRNEFPVEWIKELKHILRIQPYHRTALEYLVSEVFGIDLWDAAKLINQVNVRKITHSSEGFGIPLTFYYNGPITPDVDHRMDRIISLITEAKVTGTEKHNFLIAEIVSMVDTTTCEINIKEPRLDLGVKHNPTDESYGFEIESTLQTADIRRFTIHFQDKLIEIMKKGHFPVLIVPKMFESVRKACKEFNTIPITTEYQLLPDDLWLKYGKDLHLYAYDILPMSWHKGQIWLKFKYSPISHLFKDELTWDLSSFLDDGRIITDKVTRKVE